MKKITFLFAFFLTCCCGIKAQKLINPIENQLTIFNEEERIDFERYNSSGFSKNVQWIHLSSVQELIDEEGYLSFTLPEQGEYRMKIIRNEVEDEDNFVYAAETEKEGEAMGDNIILVNTNGYIAGSIQVNDELYRIIPITSEVQVLIKSADELANWCGTNELERVANAPLECTMNNDACTINIMYVIDNDTATKTFLSKSSILALCKFWTEDLNTALKNSGVKHKFKLVWVEFLTSPMSVKCDLFKVQYSYMNNKNSPVYLSRTKAEADVVVFLSSSFEKNCGKFGTTNQIKAKSAEDAFAIVDIDAAITWYSVTHEVGHIMGARHENDNADLPGRAHQFYVKADLKRTMMYSDKTVGTRIKYFSNPNVKLSGVPTGEYDKFNACIIQKQGCITAALANDTNPKCSISLNGTFDKTCNPTKLDVNLVGFPLNCLPSNYTYIFEYSIDGKTFTSTCAGNSPKCSIKLPSNTKNYNIFIRVTITSTVFPNPPILVDKIYNTFSLTGCKS